jgi:hypothetical protein
MLADIDRKILRILYNYSSGRHRLPTMEELTIKTGKAAKDITRSLIRLEDQLYIIWENKPFVESIRILQSREQHGERGQSVTAGHNNTDYWTEY